MVCAGVAGDERLRGQVPDPQLCLKSANAMPSSPTACHALTTIATATANNAQPIWIPRKTVHAVRMSLQSSHKRFGMHPVQLGSIERPSVFTRLGKGMQGGVEVVGHNGCIASPGPSMRVHGAGQRLDLHLGRQQSWWSREQRCSNARKK